jgi:hypothetical protein
MGRSALCISRRSNAVVAVAAILILSACSPKDQEECIAQAAKDAKTVAAMQVLANNCQREFPASRRDDGSYAYYDSELADWVDVSGPKLSNADVDKIHQLRAEKKNAQAKADQDRKNALSQLEIASFSLTCNVDSRYIACYDKNITVNLKNNANKTINGITIDYEIGDNVDCSGALGKKFYNSISIAPGQVGSIVQNVTFDEAGPAGEMNGCVRVGGIGGIQ